MGIYQQFHRVSGSIIGAKQGLSGNINIYTVYGYIYIYPYVYIYTYTVYILIFPDICIYIHILYIYISVHTLSSFTGKNTARARLPTAETDVVEDIGLK